MDISHRYDDERKFLLPSLKWCREIDPYVKVLGLHPTEVARFKDELQGVLYITGHHKSFANSFILYNVDTMRKHLDLLIYKCLHSAKYTRRIGTILGIEEAAKAKVFSIPELDFYKGMKN